MIISEKSYVIILMIKHPTDNLDHQTKPTNTKQTSLIIKQTIVWGKSPNMFRHFPCNAVQCTNMQCWRLADVWTLGWVDLKVFERYLT